MLDRKKEKKGWLKLGAWVTRKIMMPLAGLRISEEETVFVQ